MRDRYPNDTTERRYTLREMVEASILANKVGGHVIHGIRENPDGAREPVYTRDKARRNTNLLRVALQNYDIGQDGHVIRFGERVDIGGFYEFTDHRT